MCIPSKVKVIFFEAGSAGGSVNRLSKILERWNFEMYPAGLFSLSNKSKAKQLLCTEGVEFADTFCTASGLPPDPLFRFFGIIVPTPFAIKYFVKSVKMLMQHKNACVYINNTPYPHIPLILAAILLRRKIICHLRDTITFTRIERYLLKYIDSFISLSLDARRHYIKQGIVESKIKTIYDSIDATEYEKKDLCDKNNYINIVVVGSLTYRKGQDICLKAMSKILVHNSRVMMTFVGEGDFRAELEMFVKDNKLHENVIFKGHSENISEILHDSDIGVLTSRREGMPNSVMEYMAAGLPVVVTELPGIRELVEDGVSGYIIKQETYDELATKLITLIDNPVLRVEMGKIGIIKVKSTQFTPAAEMASILSLILN